MWFRNGILTITYCQYWDSKYTKLNYSFKIVLTPQKVIFNSGSALLDPISQSLKKFGNQIGGQLFLTKPQSGQHFYERENSDPSIPNGLAFYSTTVASSYNYLERTIPENDCPLRLYIDEEIEFLSSIDREQPTCYCHPDNHLHVFRLPFVYFLIDGMNKQERHQDVIEILRTLKNHRIYTHSTNKNKDKKNLADKLIELSRRKFEDEETLRLVSNVYHVK